MIDIAKLQQSVGWLWKIAGVGGSALVALFFILDNRIQDRFDVVDGRNREISKDVGDVKTELAKQGLGIEQILRRLDGDPAKTGSGSHEP